MAEPILPSKKTLLRFLLACLPAVLPLSAEAQPYMGPPAEPFAERGPEGPWGQSARQERTEEEAGPVLITSAFQKGVLKQEGLKRPELIVTDDAVYIFFLDMSKGPENRAFRLQVYDRALKKKRAERIVAAETNGLAPTDIRVTTDGRSIYAAYEAASPERNETTLHVARFALDGQGTPMSDGLLAKSRFFFKAQTGDELCDDPAILALSNGNVLVGTRLKGGATLRLRTLSPDLTNVLSAQDVSVAGTVNGQPGPYSLVQTGPDTVKIAIASAVAGGERSQMPDFLRPSQILGVDVALSSGTVLDHQTLVPSDASTARTAPMGFFRRPNGTFVVVCSEASLKGGGAPVLRTVLFDGGKRRVLTEGTLPPRGQGRAPLFDHPRGVVAPGRDGVLYVGVNGAVGLLKQER